MDSEIISSDDDDSKESDIQRNFDDINKHEGNHFSEIVERKISNKEELIKKIMDIKKEEKTLLAENIMLQQILSGLFKGPLGHDFKQDSEMPSSSNKQTFFNMLNMIDEKEEEIRTFELKSCQEIDDLRKQISETELKYNELNGEFKSLKEKAALQSVNSNTGETFSKEEVNKLLQKEHEAEENLQYYQLEYMRKNYDLQEAIQKKRSLIEGPVNYAEYDVICTEIENNIEVTKQLKEETAELQKKIFSMINIISHLNQKLQFVQHQKGITAAEEKSLDEELNKMRSNLFEEKTKYNKMKEKNEDLQHRFILLQHPKLIDDYKHIKEENDLAQKELQQLKDAYASSMKIVTESQK
ncbi:cilia- and flagella-associated protein 184 [Parasteatoda tepidariorum]|uniref:cilia- and flagella-associated protein 184 n=1 Tax=Parasteatoda tepidariorum TaxID=114398 RepID=UPI00077FB785|nr:coiled-coil domain-containing protein 96 [Parasteatoda tepidariorum]